MPRLRFPPIWSCSLVSLLLVGMLGWHSAWADAEADREYRLKTAFLYNFTKFTQWPETSWKQWTSFDFCFVGLQRFAGVINESLSGIRVQGKPAVTRHLDPTGDFQSCRIVFIGKIAQPVSLDMMSDLLGHGSLIVGEHGDFLQNGGMIQFYAERNKLRFRINLELVRRSNIVISSKLLGLSQIVNYPVPGGQ